MGSRVSRSACIALTSLALACGFVCGLEKSSLAQDATTAKHELVDSDDFRVRISAALYLGKTKAPGALQSLTAALSDPHPAVRTSVAVALRALGDADAVGALTRQLKKEDAPATHSQIATTIEALNHPAQTAPAQPSVKYAVKIGNMKNLTGVRGDQLGNVMKQAAHTRAATIPGAVVVDDDTAAAQTHAPILVLDGAILKMGQENKNGGTVNFKAQVEFSVSKLPEHALKVALTGGATSIGTQSSLVSAKSVNALEDQAIDGAVESALNGCDVGLAQAVK